MKVKYLVLALKEVWINSNYQEIACQSIDIFDAEEKAVQFIKDTKMNPFFGFEIRKIYTKQ